MAQPQPDWAPPSVPTIVPHVAEDVLVDIGTGNVGCSGETLSSSLSAPVTIGGKLPSLLDSNDSTSLELLGTSPASVASYSSAPTLFYGFPITPLSATATPAAAVVTPTLATASNPTSIGATAVVTAVAAKGKGPSIPQPPGTKVYVVQPKDTVAGITLKFGMSQGQLCQINRITGNIIFPGQQLYVKDSEAIAAAAAATAAAAAASVAAVEAQPIVPDSQTALGEAVAKLPAAPQSTSVSHILANEPIIATDLPSSPFMHLHAMASPELTPVTIILFNDKALYKSVQDGVIEGRMVVTPDRFVYQSRRLNLSIPMKHMKECVLLPHLREEFGIDNANAHDEIQSEANYKYFRLRVATSKGVHKYYDFAVAATTYEKLFDALMTHGGFDSEVSEIFMSGEVHDGTSVTDGVPSMTRQPSAAANAVAVASTLTGEPRTTMGLMSMLTNSFNSSFISSAPKAIPNADAASTTTATAETTASGTTPTDKLATTPDPDNAFGALLDGIDSERGRSKSILMRLGPAILNTLSSATSSLLPEDTDGKKKKKTQGEEDDDWEAVDYDHAEHGTDTADVQSIRSVDSRLAPSLNRNTELLTAHQVAKLASQLPGRLKVQDWDLVYSTFVNGITLSTLYNKMAEKPGPTLMIVRDQNGQLFGAFCGEPWHIDTAYYGTGENFLFKLTPEYKQFKWSTKNSYFQLGQPDYLALGGGGTFGLFLDHDLYHGSSNECSTYNNEILSSTSDFTCLGLEIWGFMA